MVMHSDNGMVQREREREVDSVGEREGREDVLY